MQLKNLLVVLFASFLLFSIQACSEDSNPTEPTQEKPDQISMKEITIPEQLQQSQDAHARVYVVCVNLANGFQKYTALLNPPDTAKINKELNTEGDGTYTWVVEGVTFTLYYSENSVSRTWKIVLNGSDPYDGSVYIDWVYIEASESLDGASGRFVVYEPVTINIETEWSWITDTIGIYNFEIVVHSNDGFKINITNNPDNSGTLNWYDNIDGNYVLKMQITWTSAGTGEWWEYEAGVEVATGKFP